MYQSEIETYVNRVRRQPAHFFDERIEDVSIVQLAVHDFDLQGLVFYIQLWDHASSKKNWQFFFAGRFSRHGGTVVVPAPRSPKYLEVAQELHDFVLANDAFRRKS